MGRIIIYSAVGLSVLIGALLVASQIIRPPDLHDFESRDLYKTSAAQAYSGDEGLLLDLGFDQILGDDLAGSQALDVHVYPNFLPQIRRYAWYPYRESDSLKITPSWGAEVAEVTLDDAPLPLTAVIELSAQDHGREFVQEARTAEGDRAASYVILVMPHTFPPLKTQISSAEDVAPPACQ